MAIAAVEAGARLALLAEVHGLDVLEAVPGAVVGQFHEVDVLRADAGFIVRAVRRHPALADDRHARLRVDADHGDAGGRVAVERAAQADAMISMGLVVNCLAFSALQRMAAPAPSLVAQISYRRSGSVTMAELSTSSTVNSRWYRALGLSLPCLLMVTLTLARCSSVSPNLIMRLRISSAQ